ncbi:MAG: recombinase family protein [Cloacibacillus sp.]
MTQNDKAQQKHKELTLNGYYTAPKAPYGYKLVKIKRPGGEEVKRIKPNPQEAEIVRLIYSLYAKDISIGDIAYRLDEAGYPSPGGKKWSEQTIARLLFDQATRMRMLGHAVFGARNEKDQLKDVTEWTIKSDAHEAIITREMCDAVDGMRTSPNHGRGGARRTPKE